MELVERFILRVQEKRVFPDLEDRLLWKEYKDGTILVKFVYGALENISAVLFPRSIIWNSSVLIKVLFCLGKHRGVKS